MTAGYDDLNNVPTQTAGSSPVLASDWNTYVRDNFDSLKFGHVVVANTGALPSADEGTMAYVSDVNKVFVFNGSVWCEIFDLDNVASVSSVKTLRSVPVGVINQYVGSTAPDGWLFCDGGDGSGTGSGSLNASAGTAYADLWGVLNSAGFSGIGSQSAMLLPDLRGRVPVGKGTNGDVDALGDSDGISTVANRRPKHYHDISGSATSGGVDHTHGGTTGNAGGHSHTIGLGREVIGRASGGSTFGKYDDGGPIGTSGVGDHSHSFTTGYASAYLHTHSLSGTVGPTSSSPLDGPAFITVNYIIKY